MFISRFMAAQVVLPAKQFPTHVTFKISDHEVYSFPVRFEVASPLLGRAGEGLSAYRTFQVSLAFNWSNVSDKLVYLNGDI